MAREAQTILDNYTHNKHFLQTVNISPKFHKGQSFVYVKNSKSACTAVLLNLFTNWKPYCPIEMGVIDFNTVHKYLPRRLGLAGNGVHSVRFALDALQDEDRFCFTLIRDPVRRTVSSFTDKIMSGQKERKQLLKHIDKPNTQNITIQEFVDILYNDPKALDLNRHWRPQVLEIGFGQIDYDYIGIVETYEIDMTVIMDRCFGQGNYITMDSRITLGHQSNSEKVMQELDRSTLKKIKHIFAEDLAMYREVKSQPIFRNPNDK